MADAFRCSLVTPEAQLLDEEVVYASIPAWDGQIGLAPQRAPLLARLGDGVLRLDFAKGGSRYFFLGGGFAQLKDNRLSLLTDEAVPVEEIVRADAEAARRAAQAREARTPDEVQQKRRAVQRAETLLLLLDRRGGKV